MILLSNFLSCFLNTRNRVPGGCEGELFIWGGSRTRREWQKKLKKIIAEKVWSNGGWWEDL
jgi:hypothetical protein